MVTESKYAKLAFQVISVLFFIAIGVCIIVDFAINKRITWAGYPVISIVFSWVILLPLLLAKRKKVLLSLITSTVATIPFLFLLDSLTPSDSWAYGLGTPIAVIAIVTTWIVLLMFRYLKINYWYKSAVAVFLYGVIMSPATNFFVDRFLMDKSSHLFNLNNLVNIFSSMAIVILLFIIGFNKKQKVKLNETATKLQ